MNSSTPQKGRFQLLSLSPSSPPGLAGRLVTRLRRLWAKDPVAGYSRRKLPRDILLVSAWASRERLVNSAFDLVSYLPSPLGVVMVDYMPEPREWSSGLLGKRKVQEQLLSVRDLLAQSFVDVAVVCPALAVEIVLERSGVLEIRSGKWNESRIVGVLEHSGLIETAHLHDRPAWAEPGTILEQDRDRLRQFRTGLELSMVAD
jgi:hypothetical protein